MASHRDDPGDDELAPAEQARLARWQPNGAPPGFADRVLAAPRPTPRRHRAWLAAPLVAVACAAGAAVAWWPGPTPVVELALGEPRRVVAARAALPIGRRAVAVAEAGAALAWQQLGGATVVGQDRGDVFYRVDRGGPFTVVTPAGQVEVTGTCFRVEIVMSPVRSAVLGGAVGAALAAAAVVTVYEGEVVVVGDRGRRPAVAGEQVTLAPGGAPTPSPAPGGPQVIVRPPTDAVALALPPAPTEATTRDELLRRDQAQREQLAMLSQRIAQLEAAAGGGSGGGGPPRLMGEGSWVDPSPAELATWAKECRIRLDLPPVMRGEPMTVQPEWIEQLKLTDAEVAAANQVFAEHAREGARRVRGWYLEATDDAAGADALSAFSMGQELQDKALPREPELLQQRLAQERAGLEPPPADLAKTSPFERYFRALVGLGDEVELLLAAKIGPEKAHGLRLAEGGWPMRMDMAGCPAGK